MELITQNQLRNFINYIGDNGATLTKKSFSKIWDILSDDIQKYNAIKDGKQKGRFFPARFASYAITQTDEETGDEFVTVVFEKSILIKVMDALKDKIKESIDESEDE